ncbi:MAG: type IA DNA topoisomerase, partial [Betaproteobacteria bacterium]|nr:type IA DNA topoisomerase [Betaproteobacteria bacterium]
MKLMIIESPNKIKKLAPMLGDDWKIVASIGHIRDLPQKRMGVEPPDFKPEYELSERGAGVVAKLKPLVRSADEIYLATDPDREGEAISWHLADALSLTQYKRVRFNAISEKAVRQAIAAPDQIDSKEVASQEARRVLDRLTGYMVSPLISDALGETASAGRVQSPAVRLVVDRERQIRNFKVTNHFGALLRFAGPAGEWRAEWQTKPDFASDDAPYVLDRALAVAAAGVKIVQIVEYEEGEQKRSPPAPFTTSTLLQAASVALKLNPKAAMDTAQALFEQGHITYHRTDNPNLEDDAWQPIGDIAAKLGLDMAPSLRRFKVSADAQAGHPAISPTHWEIEAAGETEAQRGLYALIRLRAVASQLADARYATRSAKLAAVSPETIDGKPIAFLAQGRTLVFKGWLQLIDGDATQEGGSDNEADNPIPPLIVGDRVDADRGEVLEKKTRPPKRFTLASLADKLDSEGIGRPSTYAAIMTNIVNRGYVREEKQQVVVPTELGERMVDELVGRFSFLEYAYTRDIERDLDRIAKGKADYRATLQGVYDKLNGEIGASGMASRRSPKSAGQPCPDCGGELHSIGKGYKCAAEACGFILWLEIAGRKLAPAEV